MTAAQSHPSVSQQLTTTAIILSSSMDGSLGNCHVGSTGGGCNHTGRNRSERGALSYGSVLIKARPNLRHQVERLISTGWFVIIRNPRQSDPEC